MTPSITPYFNLEQDNDIFDVKSWRYVHLLLLTELMLDALRSSATIAISVKIKPQLVKENGVAL